MQEVSMAAWRQNIFIELQGGHACIEVRLRRRGAGNVQRVRGTRRRVHTSRGFSEPSTRPDALPKMCFWIAWFFCICVHALRRLAWRPLIVHVLRSPFARAQLVGAPAGVLATHLPRPRGAHSQWHRASASHFGSTPLRRRWQGQSTGAGGSLR